MNTETINRDWVGRVIDAQFPLLQWLGGSGQSGVFLTEFKDSESAAPSPRKAAIRVILANYPTAHAQLMRWKAAAKLSHPHLMKLLHMGQSQVDTAGVVYCVTEYADEVLSDVLKDRPLKPDEVRDMLVPVLDALFYLHGNRYVHGHLKPSNVLVVNNKLQLSGDTLEAVGEPGTYHRKLDVYDAPEAGRAMMAPAADVWSLGMTLIAALTQHPPAWDRARDLYQEKEPTVPRELPEPFAKMVRKCLRLDPAERCTLADLNKARSEQTPAQPEKQTKAADPIAPLAEARKGGPVGIFTAAAVVVVVVIFIIFYLRPHAKDSTTASQPAAAEQSVPQAAAPAATTEKPHAAIAESPRAGSGVAPRPNAGTATAGMAQMTASANSSATHRVMPQPPQSALNTIQGTVRVKIQLSVDANGNVTNASFASAGPSRYFANMALAAAQQWKFAPGSPSPQTVEFDFTQGGVTASVE